ncbi:MAG: triose-phosphate isomerase [Armatimonadetes bacterium]|nr:triose-phosphate isomerase [Armatimonadota bacterium]
MRRKIIAGNWKMNKTVGEALALVKDLAPLVAGKDAADVLVCPPFTALHAVKQALGGTNIGLGAQGAFWKGSGAYTSQISIPMLADVGVQYVILGHSETRGRFGVPEPDMTPDLLKTFGETDSGVNIKAQAVLAANLNPIICVGETLDERQQGHIDDIVTMQVTRALENIAPELIASHVVFAYEPVWAIGTGETCAPDEADRVCGVVRQAVAQAAGQEAADAVRIQYGGSMKPDNAADLLARPNIDGGLIGGASLKAADFAAIVAASG